MARVNIAAVYYARALDSNADPISGGRVRVYEAGTTDEISLTTDLAGSIPASQPVSADADGYFPDLYCEPQSIKIVIENADGVEQVTYDNLLASNDLKQFENRTDAIAANISPDINFLRTAGYTTRGDSGGGLYVRVASEPAHGLKFQSADGAHWELIPEDGVISTRQAGAVCDVTGDFNGDSTAEIAAENVVIDAATDDTAAIQAAIDYALYYAGNTSSAQPVRVRHVGKSRITDTIHMGYGTSATAVLFEGVSIAPLRGEDSFTGSALLCTFSDRPMINIQQARGSEIHGLFLRHGLDYSLAATTTGKAITLEATWDAVRAVNRYALTACITIDAYSGTRPVTSYPDVTYPSFLGVVPQYGKGGTSRGTIKNCIFKGAQYAIALKPSDDSFNVDFIRIIDCFVEYCKGFVSVGNGQGRNLAIIDCEGARIFEAFVNAVHGKQQGQFGGPIKNFSVGGFCGRFFSFGNSSAIGASTSFENWFAENLHRVGDIAGATSGDAPMVVRGGRWNFRWDDTNGVPADCINLADNTSKLRIENVEFTGFPDVVGTLNAAGIQCVNCNMADAEPAAATRKLHNATAGGFIGSLKPQSRGFHEFTFSQRDIDTGAETRVVDDRRLERTGRSFCASLWGRTYMHSGASTTWNEISTPRPHFYHTEAKGTCWSGASRTDKTITATWTGMTLDELQWKGGAVGDLWVDTDTGTAGYVATAVQNGADVDMTFVMLNNYISDGAGGFDVFGTLDLASGDVEFANCRVYATSNPLYAVATASSTTLACRSGDGTAIATVLTNSGIVAGDMIFSASRRHNHFSTEVRAKVASVSSPNITMGTGGSAETWGTTNSPISVDWWIRP